MHEGVCELFVWQAHLQSEPASRCRAHFHPSLAHYSHHQFLGHRHLRWTGEMILMPAVILQGMSLVSDGHKMPSEPRVTFSSRKLHLRTHFTRSTLLESVRSASVLTREVDRLCRPCFFSTSSRFQAKSVIWMMITWRNIVHRLAEQNGFPLPQTNEWSPPCHDGCQGGWGKGNF